MATPTAVKPSTPTAPTANEPRMLALRHDARGQIDRMIYGIPLPTALAEELDKHYGKQANYKVAELIAPLLFSTLNVTMPSGSMVVKMAADPVLPAIDSMRRATIRAFNVLRQPVNRQAVEAKMKAKIAASTNQAIMNATDEHITKCVGRVLDTYFSQQATPASK